MIFCLRVLQKNSGNVIIDYRQENEKCGTEYGRSDLSWYAALAEQKMKMVLNSA